MALSELIIHYIIFEQSLVARFSTSAAPRLFTPSSNTSSGHRKMTGSSLGKLHKKWRSTSDFDRSAAGTPTALSVYRKSTTGGSSLREALQSKLFRNNFQIFMKKFTALNV